MTSTKYFSHPTWIEIEKHNRFDRRVIFFLLFLVNVTAVIFFIFLFKLQRRADVIEIKASIIASQKAKAGPGGGNKKRAVHAVFKRNGNDME